MIPIAIVDDEQDSIKIVINKLREKIYAIFILLSTLLYTLLYTHFLLFCGE